MFVEHLKTLAGKRVIEWRPGQNFRGRDLVFRVGIAAWGQDDEWDQWEDKFEAFRESADAARTMGLVIGVWSDETTASSKGVVQRLVAAAKKLPNLGAVFIGDMTREENEISWIMQTELSPLLRAYPKLHTLGVRGGNGLSFKSLAHPSLRSLTIEAGGLSKSVVKQVAAAKLAKLEELTLWLGTPDYGGNAGVADLRPILQGKRFPKLKHLGLCNAQFTDAIAVALVKSPVLKRLATLDLSLGTLGDKGAAALLANPATAKLKKLDIHHHYCSPAMVARLKKSKIKVDASCRKEAELDDWGEETDANRYVAVGE